VLFYVRALFRRACSLSGAPAEEGRVSPRSNDERHGSLRKASNAGNELFRLKRRSSSVEYISVLERGKGLGTAIAAPVGTDGPADNGLPTVDGHGC